MVSADAGGAAVGAPGGTASAAVRADGDAAEGAGGVAAVRSGVRRKNLKSDMGPIPFCARQTRCIQPELCRAADIRRQYPLAGRHASATDAPVAEGLKAGCMPANLGMNIAAVLFAELPTWEAARLRAIRLDRAAGGFT